jgi:hypothetical protein
MSEVYQRLGRWPCADEPGQFVVGCSCGAWVFRGTAREIAAAGGGHDDSPFRRHVVMIRARIVQAADEAAGV